MSNNPEPNKDKEPKKDEKNPLDTGSAVVMRMEVNLETGEERPLAVAQATPVRHDDHYHLVPTGNVLSPLDVQMMGIKSVDDAFRAFEGDAGVPKGSSTSVGFSRKYSNRWDSIFENKDNKN